MGKRFIVFLFCHLVILFFKGIRVFFPLTQSLFLVIVTTHLSFMAFSQDLLGSSGQILSPQGTAVFVHHNPCFKRISRINSS